SGAPVKPVVAQDFALTRGERLQRLFPVLSPLRRIPELIEHADRLPWGDHPRRAIPTCGSLAPPAVDANVIHETVACPLSACESRPGALRSDTVSSEKRHAMNREAW